MIRISHSLKYPTLSAFDDGRNYTQPSEVVQSRSGPPEVTQRRSPGVEWRAQLLRNHRSREHPYIHRGVDLGSTSGIVYSLPDRSILAASTPPTTPICPMNQRRSTAAGTTPRLRLQIIDAVLQRRLTPPTTRIRSPTGNMVTVGRYSRSDPR